MTSAGAPQSDRHQEPRGVHLVGRRPAARRLQAVRVRQGDPAADGDPPAGLRARADQGRPCSTGTGSSRAGSRTSSRSCRPSPGEQFYNTSPLTFTKLLDDPSTIADSLQPLHRRVLGGRARTSSTSSTSASRSTGCDEANLLYQVVGKFAEIDLHPDAVSNIEMGYLYEELIRRFSELSNETAGEHFTPREVIRLMVNLLFIDDDDDVLTKPGIVKTLYDPACGTGGMLSVAEDHLRELQPAGPARGLRPGAERRDLRDLPLGHDAQGPGRLPHRLRQLASPRTTTRASASTTCSPTRRSGSSGRRSRTRSRPRPRRRASTAGSAPGCRGSTTARSCSCST